MATQSHIPASTDHWWPKAIQREFWVDKDGFVYRKKMDGAIDRKKPLRGKKSKDQFGAIYKGHWMGDFGPWSHTFEPEFEEIDRLAPETLARVCAEVESFPSVPFSVFSKYRTRTDRLHSPPTEMPIEASLGDLKVLFLWAMSITYRSPGYRRRMSLAPNAFGRPADAEIGKANAQMHWASMKELVWPVEGHTRVVFRRTKTREFIFGDWIHESITSMSPRFKEMNDRWHLIVDGYLSIAVSPSLLLQFVFDPFADQNCSSFVCDVPVDFVDDVNRHMTSKSEEIFFRNGE